MTLRALIAEDEPIFAATLAATLRRLWPELDIAGTAPNGVAAVQQALELQPDILFLDIKMPGQSGDVTRRAGAGGFILPLVHHRNDERVQ